MEYTCEKNIFVEHRVSLAGPSFCSNQMHRQHWTEVESWQAFMDSEINPGLHQTQQMSGSMLRNAALGKGHVAGDTVLLCNMSETSINGDMDQAPPSPEATEVLGVSQGRRKKGKSRELVDEEHLCTLVAAYNLLYENYSEGRANVTQTILSMVWKHMYDTYKKAHPLSTFKEESLKDRLRETLKEFNTGNLNAKSVDIAALQCNKVMSGLRCTDGHAKSAVLRKRQRIVQGTYIPEAKSEISEDSDPSWMKSPTMLSPRASPDLESRGDIPITPPNALKKKPRVPKETTSMSKAQMLFRQSSSIEKLVKAFEKSTVQREVLVDIKMSENVER